MSGNIVPGLDPPPRWEPVPPTPTAMPSGEDLPDISDLTQRLLSNSERALERMEALAFSPMDLSLDMPDWSAILPPPALIGVELPELRDIVFSVFDPPANTLGSLSVDDIDVPALDAVAPELTIGVAPAPNYGAAPTRPSVDFNFDIPAAPTLNLPTRPDLMSISDVTFDGVTLPTFDATEPTLDLLRPTVTPYVEGAQYTSALLDALRDDIMRAMRDGDWTGLPGVIETGLWDREREREAIAQAQSISELDKLEATGFAFAPGVYVDARLKIINETNAKIVGLSREIMIKQADLHLTNIMKMRELGVQLEGKLMDLANAVATRALEAARYVTQAMVEVYNAEVRAYGARLEGYRARAAVYEYQMRGALAIVDIFKARIDAERAKAEINQSMVGAYRAEIEAATAYVDIYKTQLQAVEVQAQLQRTKIEAFGEDVRAYTAGVGAYTAQVEAFKTGVQAQGVAMDAYRSRVEAYKAQVDAGLARVNTRVEAYKGRVAGYEAELTGYRARVEAEMARVKATAEWNGSRVEAFRAQVQGVVSYNDSNTRQWEAGASMQVKSYELEIKAAEAQVQLAATKLGLTSELMRAYGQVAGQLGAAALNAVHYGMNVSWSQAESWAQSYGTSYSNSYSNSTNYSYNTNTER